MSIVDKLKKTTLSHRDRAELRKLLNATKRAKSVELTEAELAKLKAAIDSFPTQEKAAEAIGITRGTLIRVRMAGSASEETVNHLRAYLENK